MNIDTEKLASALKIDEEKVFEALPAMATIIEKAELIDYATSLGAMTTQNGLKIAIRVVSRMKEYEEEVDDALSILFNVDSKSLKGSEKMKLLTKILTEKDVSGFF